MIFGSSAESSPRQIAASRIQACSTWDETHSRMSSLNLQSQNEKTEQETSSATSSETAVDQRLPILRMLDVFILDPRSLALFRIIFATVLLIDVFYRWIDLSFFYSDEGLLSREVAIRNLPIAAFSAHLMNGTWQFQALLFLITALAHAAMLVGYRTRFATVLSWFLVVSVDRRNNLILQGGDDLGRALIFWSMFLPLDGRWSVDNIRLRRRPQTRGVHTPASAAIMIQMAWVYLVSAVLKSAPSWRVEGTAIRYALELDQFTKPFGYFLRAFPELLRVMTFGVWYMELLACFLPFVLWRNSVWRTIVPLAFIFFHFGLFLSLELGPFPFVCMAGWCVYFPGAFWDLVWPKSKVEDIGGPPPVLSRARKLMVATRDVVVLFFLANLAMWNLRTTDFPRFEKWYPKTLNFICQGAGIDQYWGMFAPTPLTLDGWYVIPATTVSGRTINFTPGSQPDDPITDEKPLRVSQMYKTERWRKFLMNLMMKENEWQRPLFVVALSRRWNAEHRNDHIKTIDIYYWMEPTVLDGPPERRKELLWHYDSALK